MSKTRKKTDKDKIRKISKTVNKLALGGRNNVLYYKSLVSEIIDKGDYDYFSQCLIINYNIDVMKYRSISEMENATWENICFQTLTPVQEKLKTFYSKQNIYQLGYNIYSDDISYLSLTWSSPLSSTYSVVGTSSRISFLQVNNLVNINFLDSNFYYVKIQEVTWKERSGMTLPVDINNIYSLSSGTYSHFTQSSYNSNIPTDHGGNYLILAETRDPYTNWYYTLSTVKNNFLGTIEEISSFDNDPLFYNKNPEIAKVLGLNRTYLKVDKVGATQSLIFTDTKETISEDMNLYNRYTQAIKYLKS